LLQQEDGKKEAGAIIKGGGDVDADAGASEISYIIYHLRFNSVHHIIYSKLICYVCEKYNNNI